MSTPTSLTLSQLVSICAVVLLPDRHVTEQDVDDVLAAVVAAFPATAKSDQKRARHRLVKSMVDEGDEGDDD